MLYFLLLHRVERGNMNTITIRLIIKLIQEKAKTQALMKTLVDNNIISKDELNKNIHDIMSNENLLQNELLEIFPDDSTNETITSMLNYILEK